ncbi:putative actin-crosslinking [Helianthus anomalus]
MEFFQRAKSVRLKSYHHKYLLADEDGEHVSQDRQATVKNARWTVEFDPDYDNVIRLISCYGRYLTASEDHHLLGTTGQKVIQSVPRKIDSSVEWEPVLEGSKVRLKTRYGNYLRANGGVPPWRNSITHDIPHRHHNWILWDVEVVELNMDPPKQVPDPDVDVDLDLDSSSFRLTSDPSILGGDQNFGSGKNEGRMIYYKLADDDGVVVDAEGSFLFKGKTVEDLTQNLEEETELENITVCSVNPLNGKLYPLRLALPPNNTTMHVIVVPATSKAAKDF